MSAIKNIALLIYW